MSVFLRLAVPRKQHAAQAAKAKVSQETEQSDHDDPRKDPLGPEGLLRFEDHIADADRRADHLGGNDHDERDPPRKPDTSKNMRQASRQHYAGKDFSRAGSQGFGRAEEVRVDAAHACISVEDHWEGRGEPDNEDLRPIADAEP